MQSVNQDIENATDGLHKFIHKQLTQNVSTGNGRNSEIYKMSEN